METLIKSDGGKKTDGSMVTQESGRTPHGMLDLRDVALLRQHFARFVSEQLKENVHYGKIPGSIKPSLLQAGAYEIVRLYNCTATFPNDLMTVDKDLSTGYFCYTVCCRVVDGHGVIRAEGLGCCSTFESRYRYRLEWWNRPGQPAGNEWLRRGTRWARRIPNPDIFDLQNTALKMATKRAVVAAAQALGCAAEMFTQDLEDLAVEEPSITPPDPEPITPTPVQNTAALEDLRGQVMKKIHDLGWNTEKTSAWLKQSTGKQNRHEVSLEGWRNADQRLEDLLGAGYEKNE